MNGIEGGSKLLRNVASKHVGDPCSTSQSLFNVLLRIFELL